ncbi:MAG TPA: DUF2782 domain-containing protein [Chromatiaceae bacterium]|nr:DUF2782 domain-containing protein [Chromatiaceae bacterium]
MVAGVLRFHPKSRKSCSSYNKNEAYSEALFMKIPVAVLLLVLLMPATRAEQEPPSMPADENGEIIAPEVIIKQSGEKAVHEYRIDGRLYMVKIVPRKGPPYYLLDLDGDGIIDVTEEDPARMVVPQWILFRW